MMLNELRATKYVVEFFQSGTRGAVPDDKLHLKADTESDAVAQANWIARHTHHHHFQIRAVVNGVHTVIFESYPLASAA